jgi:drug/metabolite transporter (DMT)-like permease
MNQNLLLIITTIIALIPVFLIKKYILTDNKKYIYASLIFYVLLTICYINLFRIGEISSLYTVLQITQIIVIVIGGLILFGEKITVNKIIGIFAAIISILFLLKK